MALKPVSRIDDYQFPEGAFDVRGWVVRTEEDREKVGRVEEMLLDRTGGLRYLDVDLGFLKKHVLVPLDHAHADGAEKTVWIDGFSRDRLESVPEYALEPEALDEDYELRIDAVFGGTAASTERNLVAQEPNGERDLELRRMEGIEDRYRVAGDDPRGWKLLTGDGRIIGRVAELLVDTGSMKARYLDVAVDESELELEPVDRHVLLPVDRVRLDRGRKRVVVGGLLADDVKRYPHYGGLPVRYKHAREIEHFFDRAVRGEDGVTGRAGAEPPEQDWRDTTIRHFYRTRPRTRSQTPTED